MSDRWVAVLAASAAVGALRPSGLPLVVVVLGVAGALTARRPALLCIATALLVSALAQRAVDGLDGLEPGSMVGEVVLLSDPEPTASGVRAEVRFAGRRLELRAGGSAAAALEDRLAGERVRIRAEQQPLPDTAGWLRSRHLAGRLRVLAVEGWRPGGAPAQVANGLRRTLAAGTTSMSADERALYTGLVLGDDRHQDPVLLDDFRGAGLLHLSAVSGQNVAFVLVLAGPVLRRLRLWPRLAATLVTIALFALMTRFEPSVLRASAMAAVATTTTTLAAPLGRLRVLALATTGLLIADPLLVSSVGFRLSLAAAAAIVLLAGPLAAALPGPRVLREALAVTIAAQLGVAPVLLGTFGPIPVASLPANLLAVPAAGPVMMWGLTGGLVAGVAPPDVASALHLPTRVLLGWLREVARGACVAPLGELGVGHVTAVGLGLGLALWGRRQDSGRLRGLGLLVAAVAVVSATLVAQAPTPLRSALAPGVVRWHAGPTDVVVLGGIGGRSPLAAASTLAALRGAGVRGVEVLVVADASVPSAVVAAITTRHPVGVIVTTPGVELTSLPPGAVTAPRPGATVEIGSLIVRLTATVDRLVVEARPR